MELRDIHIGLDTSGLHGNSDRPSYYHGWLVAPDSMLPLRGAGHRAVKMSPEEAKDLKACVINDFTSSELWKLQGFPPSSSPPALPEGQFHLPSAKSFLQSNDARKNMTDMQETAQWLSGEALWTQLLQSLLGSWALKIKLKFIYFSTILNSQTIFFAMIIKKVLKLYHPLSKCSPLPLPRYPLEAGSCGSHNMLRWDP